MLIDRTHKIWGLTVAVIAAIAGGSYLLFYISKGYPPTSGSIMGLTFGSLSLLCMLFAGALSVRKRFRDRHLGRAQFWMRGHLWLGSLALPLAWLHGGFRLGGTLTSLLMYLTYFVFVSGWVGAALQHFLPRLMTGSVRSEVPFQQIPVVLDRLRAEAYAVALAAGPPNGDSIQQWRANASVWLRQRHESGLMTSDKHKTLEALVASPPPKDSTPVADFYEFRVKPYLAGQVPDLKLSAEESADGVFQAYTQAVAPNLRPAIFDLERICAEYRTVLRQRSLHRLLHGWIFFHVLPSVALLALAVVHAVGAMRYLQVGSNHGL
jgi:hypothetical protein